jgi:hypothetical protein
MRLTRDILAGFVLIPILSSCNLVGDRAACADPYFLAVRPELPQSATDVEEICMSGLNPTVISNFSLDAGDVERFKTWSEISKWKPQSVNWIDRLIWHRKSAIAGSYGNGAVMRDITIYSRSDGKYEIDYRGTDID